MRKWIFSAVCMMAFGFATISCSSDNDGIGEKQEIAFDIDSIADVNPVKGMFAWTKLIRMSSITNATYTDYWHRTDQDYYEIFFRLGESVATDEWDGRYSLAYVSANLCTIYNKGTYTLAKLEFEGDKATPVLEGSYVRFEPLGTTDKEGHRNYNVTLYIKEMKKEYDEYFVTIKNRTFRYTGSIDYGVLEY